MPELGRPVAALDRTTRTVSGVESDGRSHGRGVLGPIVVVMLSPVSVCGGNRGREA